MRESMQITGPANEQPENSARNTMNHAKRILLIDDEEVITFGFAKVLQEPGIEVHCANTMEAAHEYIAHNIYAAAIIDLRLSNSVEIEGLSCVRLLRASQSDCRIIILTAYGNLREQANALGINRFFEKPLSPEKIRETLEEFGIYKNSVVSG